METLKVFFYWVDGYTRFSLKSHRFLYKHSTKVLIGLSYDWTPQMNNFKHKKLSTKKDIVTVVSQHTELPEVMSHIKYQLWELYFDQYRSVQTLYQITPHTS